MAFRPYDKNIPTATKGGNGMTKKKLSDNGRPLTCDQVSWMISAIDRYIPGEPAPAISRRRKMEIYGLLYELMEAADLGFMDHEAKKNATPEEVL